MSLAIVEIRLPVVVDEGEGIDGLPGMLLARGDERFASCVTKKMLTYALGRGMVQGCDAGAIEGLAAQLKADNYKLRNHLVRIVQSPLFISPRARLEAPP